MGFKIIETDDDPSTPKPGVISSAEYIYTPIILPLRGVLGGIVLTDTHESGNDSLPMSAIIIIHDFRVALVIASADRADRIRWPRLPLSLAVNFFVSRVSVKVKPKSSKTLYRYLKIQTLTYLHLIIFPNYVNSCSLSIGASI